ncbi:hypothetical protein [Micromonospora sp. WMMA1947]|uniref:hypothetical protein n=1 Tax=Micromonospora sp. WMMA1947 TaxID=3015163 RepID=UPI00248BB7C2|nr:hypothetical protein [Micromonospora sp. WMMA1947]WBC10714.1 hypothetical protein O7604_07510 [Micromonospora sp. WMMA1947]
MTGHLWPAVLLLAAAAVAVAWPVRAGRARRLAILGDAGTPAERARGAGPASPARPPRRPLDSGPKASARPPGRGRERRRPGAEHQARRWPDLEPAAASGWPASASGMAQRVRRWARLGANSHRSADHSPAAPALSAGRVLPVAALGGAVTGALLGGPVAALVLATYGVLAARAVLRRRTHRTAALAHRRELDRLGAVAADLRAGLPADGGIDDGPGRVARLALAAGRLADRTGAPLADLLERIEADARAADRGLAAAAAQAAGARATAWLLAALPLGGIGLGYGIGVDPVAVLLHTPVGGGSAVAAVVLQVGGLLWAERLGVTPGQAA